MTYPANADSGAITPAQQMPAPGGAGFKQLLLNALETAPATATNDTLLKGHSLREGDTRTSPNGNFSVQVKNGQVSLSDLNGKTLWTQGLANQHGTADPHASLRLGDDGLALNGYVTAAGRPHYTDNNYGSLWSADLANLDKSRIAGLQVTNDGRLVLLDSNRTILTTLFAPPDRPDEIRLHYPVGASNGFCHVVAMGEEAFRSADKLMVPGTPTPAPDPWQLLQNLGLTSPDHAVTVDTYNSHIGDIDATKKTMHQQNNRTGTATADTAGIAANAMTGIRNIVHDLNSALTAADGIPTTVGPLSMAKTASALSAGILPAQAGSMSGTGQFDRAKERALLARIFDALDASYQLVRGAQEQIQEAAARLGKVPNPGALTPEQVDYGNAGTWAHGEEACRQFVNQALDKLGITDPVARDNWMRGMLTIASRESQYNSPKYQVNTWDTNAIGPKRPDGAPGRSSRGPWQTIPEVFAAHHQIGTSTNIYDPVANAAAAIKYLQNDRHVSPDASDFTKLVQQADPNRGPRGY
ncbi:hypothetical protein [Nocardia sp. NPDC049149]|uniref:hypothetical protein n=1 Tax=Nocardia sp. NPDC049149 TaxID=3364315 RepID=UPI003713F049